MFAINTHFAWDEPLGKILAISGHSYCIFFTYTPCSLPNLPTNDHVRKSLSFSVESDEYLFWYILYSWSAETNKT